MADYENDEQVIPPGPRLIPPPGNIPANVFNEQGDFYVGAGEEIKPDLVTGKMTRSYIPATKIYTNVWGTAAKAQEEGRPYEFSADNPEILQKAKESNYNISKHSPAFNPEFQKPPGPKPSDKEVDTFQKFEDNWQGFRQKNGLKDPKDFDPQRAATDAMSKVDSDWSSRMYGRIWDDNTRKQYQKERDSAMKNAEMKETNDRNFVVGVRNHLEGLFKQQEGFKHQQEVEGRKAELAKQVEQAKQEGQGYKQFTNWTPDEKEIAFRNNLIGIGPSFSGFDKVGKTQFGQEFNKWLGDKKITTGDIASIRASYKGLTGSIQFQEKQLGSAEGIINNIELQTAEIKKAFEKVGRTGLRLLDVPKVKLARIALGSGEEANIASYLIEVSNEIAKLSTNSQSSVRELSVEAADRWNKIHDPNLSLREIEKVLATTNKQAQMRRQSMEGALKKTSDRIQNLFDKRGENKGQEQKTIVETRIGSDGKKLFKYSDGTIGKE